MYLRVTLSSMPPVSNNTPGCREPVWSKVLSQQQQTVTNLSLKTLNIIAKASNAFYLVENMVSPNCNISICIGNRAI